ncbi:MAG: hypothetical protein JSV95_08495 [Gemmatimonadota bacterium]|jgi:hypothetical protein|nr:MAG: hypothetical protein JSV95_08495 [Gemmatimonadota bacterium]
MSGNKAPQQDPMERLMELQSRLRELTEEKKEKWRRLGQPLPDDTPQAVTKSSQAGPPPVVARPPTETPRAEPQSSPAVASSPTRSAESVSEPPTALPEAEASASNARADTPPEVAVSMDRQPEALDPPTLSGNGDVAAERFTRRRGSKATARAWWGWAERSADATLLAMRAAAGRLRDLNGGLGVRREGKARRGDPITPEELIDDRTLAARLIGAAVYVLGLAAVAAVALVQLGKLDVPWLDDGTLPAAVSTDGAGSEGRLAESPVEAREGSGASSAGTPVGSAVGQAGGPGSTRTNAGAADPGATESEAPEQDAPQPGGSPADSAVGDGPLGASAADSREILEFTRLQGELGFLIGEYEIVSGEFERGVADCARLTEHYVSVDNAHLQISRVVARWREVPFRQVRSYEALSASLDSVFQHYATSGCGLAADESSAGESSEVP